MSRRERREIGAKAAQGIAVGIAGGHVEKEHSALLTVHDGRGRDERRAVLVVNGDQGRER